MRIKHWLIGLLALAALVIGLGSATAFAQESEGEPARLGLFAREPTSWALKSSKFKMPLHKRDRNCATSNLKRW